MDDGRGGPAEIIEDGISGFQIDPYHGVEAADIMADFFERCAHDSTHWDAISKGEHKTSTIKEVSHL